MIPKPFHYLILPLSLLYGAGMLLRQLLYKMKVFKSYRAAKPVVIVGNLSVGGTGKTPHVEWLLERLSNDYKIAVLSRGYGRKTKGYFSVELNSLPNQVGDEPLQMKKRYPSIFFAVCENRIHGINRILEEQPDTELFILDDAFQQLRIKDAFRILLSTHAEPFFKDWVLPMGRLREFAWIGKRRADVCIFTKCPHNMSALEKDTFHKKFSETKKSHFSQIRYGAWLSIAQKQMPTHLENIVLVTGIANPSTLVDDLQKRYKVELVQYPDHHDYSSEDISVIHEIFANFDPSNTCVLTTSKDAVKFVLFKEISQIKSVPWWVVPIEINIEHEQELLREIKKYVDKYK